MSRQIKNLITILLCVLITYCAKKPPIPVSSPEASKTVYKTIQGSAIGALEKAALMSLYDEYGGCLYRLGNGYGYTVPVGNGKIDKFAVQCNIPKGSLVGIYHTHRKGNYRAGFSDNDIKTANDLGVNSYVYSINDAQVIEYVTRTADSSVSGKIIKQY